MRETVCVLGVNVDKVNMNEALKRAEDLISTGGSVFTPNPEIIMKAYENGSYRDVLNGADMVIPDGIGVVYGSKILGNPVPERVAGFDLTCGLLSYAAKNNISVYIYGGKDGVAKKAAEKIHNDFGVNVCGFEHGYHKDDSGVLKDINEKKPGILLVCLGAPKQENWIADNKENLPPCLMIGAGGSVDVLSGQTTRAPKFFLKLNLEWFYRLITEPSRFFRMLVLPKFLVTVMIHGKKYIK